MNKSKRQKLDISDTIILARSVQYSPVKVYIASPYTIGDAAINVRTQIDIADKLMNKGFVPFVPLLTHFQHMFHPRTYESWMEICKVWVLTCDCVLRLEGESKGADVEVKLAKENKKPVFYSLNELCERYKVR